MKINVAEVKRRIKAYRRAGMTERADSLAHNLRTYQKGVLEEKGGEGCRYYVESNLETGTTTGAYDSGAQGAGYYPHIPWAAICWTHASVAHVETLKAAKYLAAHPTEFCEPCVDLARRPNAPSVVVLHAMSKRLKP